MTAEATLQSAAGAVTVPSAAAATAAGEVLQLCDGRAAVRGGLAPAAIGDPMALYTQGVFAFQKTASIVIVDGAELYWDASAGKVVLDPATGADFYLGTAVGDATAAATTVNAALNAKPRYLIDLDDEDMIWTAGATDGLGVVWKTKAAWTILAFDAVAEVAKAEIYPADTEKKVPVTTGFILDMVVAIFDIGDHAALDISLGMVAGTGGADMDAEEEFIGLHLDGSALSILAESDDGTTEVAATDTTVDAVDDTFFRFTLDARNLADCQMYIDGVNVLPATVFNMAAASGPLMPTVHLEKTSNDTTADVRIKSIKLRTTDLK
jgi:predicted RecA/RadA family phage recombinase